MKSGIEQFRQLQAEKGKRAAAAAEKLNALKDIRADLESRIDAAIKEEDQASAEKLIRSRIDNDVKIEYQQKSLAILQEPIDRKAVAAAWAEDCTEYQKQIDKAEKELNQVIRQTVEKALSIADIINASWDARTSALQLVNDQEPYTYNGGNTDFPGVSYMASILNKVSELLSNEELDKIQKNAAGKIAGATRDRSNPYFHRR